MSLLNLSVEVRLMILEKLLTLETSIQPWCKKCSRDKVKVDYPIFRVCRQLKDEALEIFYSKNHFLYNGKVNHTFPMASINHQRHCCKRPPAGIAAHLTSFGVTPSIRDYHSICFTADFLEDLIPRAPKLRVLKLFTCDSPSRYFPYIRYDFRLRLALFRAIRRRESLKEVRIAREYIDAGFCKYLRDVRPDILIKTFLGPMWAHLRRTRLNCSC
jgi:hypothetical protein